MKKIIIFGIVIFFLIGLQIKSGVLNENTITKNEKELQVTVKPTIESTMRVTSKPLNTKKKVLNKTSQKDKVWGDSQGLKYRIYNYAGVVREDCLMVSAGRLTRKKIIIPNTFRGKKVVLVEDYGFKNCKKLIKITIGKNIKWIGYESFWNCMNLSEVKFKGNSCDDIGDGSFALCKSLKKIKLPNKISNIWEHTFLDSGLEEIALPKSIITVSYQAFAYCKNLKKIKLNGRLEEIEGNSFEGCTSLEKIILPKNLVKVGAEAFLGCKKLERIIFKGRINDISEKAFKRTLFEKRNRYKGDYYIADGVILETYKKKNAKVIITDNTRIKGQKVRGISGNAFSNMTIKKLIIRNIKCIGGESFNNTKVDKLEIQNVDLIDRWTFDDFETNTIVLENIKNVNQTFYQMKAEELYIKNVNMEERMECPKNLKKAKIQGLKAEECIFYGCKDLRELILDGQIKMVDYYFLGFCTSLEKVTFINTCELTWERTEENEEEKDSGWIMFSGNRNLKDVYLKIPNVDETIKEVFPEWVTLHVPAEQVDEYQKYVTCNAVAW